MQNTVCVCAFILKMLCNFKTIYSHKSIATKYCMYIKIKKFTDLKTVQKVKSNKH